MRTYQNVYSLYWKALERKHMKWAKQLHERAHAIAKRRHWRSREIHTNCLFWAIRQLLRRGGYITARFADLSYSRVIVVILLNLSALCFVTAYSGFAVLLLGLAPLFCLHFGWMPAHRRRMFHFRPSKASTQVPWLLTKGFIQINEDHE